MSQGESNWGQTRVKLAGVDPRLVAGEARDGGERRDSPSDDQKSGGGALRDAQTRAHLTGRTGEAEVAGGDDNHDDGGGRSSVEARAVATMLHRSDRLGFWDPGVVLSMVVCLDVTRVSSSHGDLVAGGNGLSGSAETMDTARN